MSRRSSRNSAFNKKDYTCNVYASNKNNNALEFIEDQPEWDGKWDKPIIYYKIIGECRTMTRREIRKALNYAMTTWDIEIPIIFKSAWWFLKTPDITIDFKGKNEDTVFRDKPSVLAYAYFPAQGSVSGQVVFNNDYLWDYLGRENRTYSIIAVLVHELGHSLGLRHDVTGNKSGIDVMDAYYSGEDRIELSERDISRIVAKYGARIYSRWNGYNRLKKAIARGKKRLIIR